MECKSMPWAMRAVELLIRFRESSQSEILYCIKTENGPLAVTA
jgi:hypothetical protein